MGLRTQQPPSDAKTLFNHHVGGFGAILNMFDRDVALAQEIGPELVKQFYDLVGYANEIMDAFKEQLAPAETQHTAKDEPPINPNSP